MIASTRSLRRRGAIPFPLRAPTWAGSSEAVAGAISIGSAAPRADTAATAAADTLAFVPPCRRHEAGSGTARNALTGHKTEAVYRRYAIVNEADVAEGLGRLAAYLDGGQGAAVR